VKRGPKPKTREQLFQTLADLEKIPEKSEKVRLKIGTVRRRLGIYKYGRGQVKGGKLTIIRVKDYIRNGGAIS